MVRTRNVNAAFMAFLAVLLLVGIPLDWRMTPFTDLHFTEHARRFEQAPAGTRVSIPVNPEGWSMTLVKR